jgi:hypothetical protein
MSYAPCLSWLFYEDHESFRKHQLSETLIRTILVVGIKPGLRDAVLQTPMQCFINRSFNKASLL